MIPIPNYLAHISKYEKIKDNTILFSIRCSCGCNTFSVYENYFTKEEKLQAKPYYDAIEYLHTGRGYGSYATIDEDGVMHSWKILSADLTEREEVVVPSQPFFCGITVFMLKCEQCNEEYVIFDNRMHGYDGMTLEKTDAVLEYQPHLRQKGKQFFQITIKVENDASLEEFNACSGSDFTEEEYSNAYTWIWIYGIDKNGKKRKLFDYETA